MLFNCKVPPSIQCDFTCFFRIQFYRTNVRIYFTKYRVKYFRLTLSAFVHPSSIFTLHSFTASAYINNFSTAFSTSKKNFSTISTDFSTAYNFIFYFLYMYLFKYFFSSYILYLFYYVLFQVHTTPNNHNTTPKTHFIHFVQFIQKTPLNFVQYSKLTYLLTYAIL